MRNQPLIFLSAGEASGDQYGAELIASVRAVLPGARFTGLGGTGMEAAGQHRVIRAEDVAVMGITEILRHVPRIIRSYRALVRSVQVERPNVAVLIDFPDVNFRLAKHLKRMGVPVIWFVSPQLWAWKRKRLRWVQARVSKMLTIFPFEEAFYRNRGVSAEFVGHPLAEAPLPTISRKEFAARASELHPQRSNHADAFTQHRPAPATPMHGSPSQMHHALDPEKPWIALLPGSRRGEIAANLDAMVDTAKLLGSANEYLIPVAPGLGLDEVRALQDRVGSRLVAAHAPRVHLVRDARAALLHSRAAVIASGTATVQAAVLGTPFVAVYSVSTMTFRLAKRLVRYPSELSAEKDLHGNLPIVMPNLIAGRRVVPELLQEHFTAAAVANALCPLLADGPARRMQLEGLAEVRLKLLHPNGDRSIAKLRDAVLDALNKPATALSSASAASASND